MSATRSLTLLRFASHDFSRALRVWKKSKSPSEIISALVSERRKAMLSGLRALGLAIVLMLWLAANKPELALHIELVDVSIPITYVNFGLAFSICATTINFVSYFVLNEFVRIASNRLLSFDAPWILTVLEDGESAWSLGMVQQFRFFASDAAHKLVGLVSALLITLPIMIIFAMLYWRIVVVGIASIGAHGIWSIETLLTVVGWLLAIYPIAVAVLLMTPFKFQKNTTFIRWNFLGRLYRRIGLQHPRVGLWLETTPRRSG